MTATAQVTTTLTITDLLIKLTDMIIDVSPNLAMDCLHQHLLGSFAENFSENILRD